MANVHILDSSGPEFRMACHIVVPAGNNSAGFPWQTALINSGIGGTTILRDGDGTDGTISATEKAQIQAGAVYEVVRTVRPDSVPGGIANVPAYLTVQYNAISTAVLADLSARLKYFGYSQ